MKKEILIKGMSCNHCVKHVTNALSDIKEVKKVEVSLKDNSAVVELKQEVSNQVLVDAITDAGYEVTEIK